MQLQTEPAPAVFRSKSQPHSSTAPAGPFLVRAAERRRPSVLAFWHLLSLDAPTVAAMWTYFVSGCCRVKLPWTSPASMFVAVWMLYAADRLLDAHAARSSHREAQLEERHRFHARHQSHFITGICICALVLSCLLFRATHTELRLFSALGSLLFAYFFLIHLWPFATHSNFSNNSRLPKELGVGIFFAAAVFIPTVARAPYLRVCLMAPALVLAAVCATNCLYIYAWEHPRERDSAHWTTRFSLRRLPLLARCITLGSLAVAALALTLHLAAPPSIAALPLACGLSAISLLLLHTRRFTMRRTTQRAAADLALLTPVLLMPFTHLFR